MLRRRILCIYSGSESARHPFARTAEVVDAAIESLREHVPLLSSSGLALEEASDERCRVALAALSAPATACVVLGTNALYSSAVLQAFRDHGEQIDAFLDAGGSLLVMPQPAGPFAELITPRTGLRQENRRAEDGQRHAVAERRDEQTIFYPFRIDPGTWVDDEASPGPFRFYEDHLTVDGDRQAAHLTVARSAGGHNLIIRSNDDQAGGRWLVSSVPADWRGDVELLADQLLWSVFGPPVAAVTGDSDDALQWLSRRTFRNELLVHFRSPPPADVADWVLSKIRFLLSGAGSQVLDPVAVRAWVARGGLAMSIEGHHAGPRARILLDVGRSDAEQAMRAARTELAKHPRWGEDGLETSAEELRDIVALHHHDQELRVGDGELIDARKRKALRVFLEKRLDAGARAGNVVAYCLRAETLIMLGGSVEVPARISAAAAGYGPAALALVDGVQGSVAGQAERLTASENFSPLSALARFGACVASLNRVGRLDLEGESANAVGRAFAEGIEAHPTTMSGWLSLPVTCDIGLAATALAHRADHQELVARLRLIAEDAQAAIRSELALATVPPALNIVARATELTCAMERKWIDEFAFLRLADRSAAVSGGDALAIAELNTSLIREIDALRAALAVHNPVGRVVANAAVLAVVILPLVLFCLWAASRSVDEVFTVAAVLIIPYVFVMSLVARQSIARGVTTGRTHRLISTVTRSDPAE